MKIHLIDIDNKYRESKRRGLRWPNLALMKISAYHKSKGDLIGFDIENPDRTYISCVFTRNKRHAIEERNFIPGATFFGGSGYNLDVQLPMHIELLKPDYDLYPTEGYRQTSLGFTTRGCIRNCPFCIVHEKEGRFRRAQYISKFHDERFKTVTLLDNNILADKDWFFENTNWCIDHNLKLDISQGMDIRLLTDEIVEQLHRIKFVDQQMRFAWDDLALEPYIVGGIQMLRDHGINTRRNVKFFVLSGYNTHFCEDLYRCNRLKELNANPYVMPYGDNPSELLKDLTRWANRPAAFWKTPFYRYDRKYRKATMETET